MQTDEDLILAAMQAGDIERLEEYCELIDTFPTGQNDRGEGWLALAIGQAPMQVIDWLIANGADLNTDQTGFPPLHAALDVTGEARYDILRRLIEAGADISQRGLNDWTPLHNAAAREDFRAIGMLLQAGADRDARTRIDDYATPEEEARYLGKLKAADMIRDWRE